MNRDEFKMAMSGVQSSEQTLERIMDMTNQNTKKIKFAPAIALVACLAIIVTGIFGGSVISARLNPIEDYITITAYANELKENQVFKSPCRLALEQSENGAFYASLINENDLADEENPVFNISGKNIKNISFNCLNGTLNLDVTETKTEPRVVMDSENKYIKELHYEDVENDETFTVNYYFFNAYRALEATKDVNYDLSKLPNDSIAIDIVYRDGKTEHKNLKISFDKEGYMLMEYIK